MLNGLTEERINNSSEKGINTGKYMAYKSLCMSSSIPIDIDIDRVIVVPDFETSVEEVEFINTETLESEIKVMPVSINHIDGAGMFLPDNINGLNKSCRIRGRWIKGVLFPFDFKEFTENIAKNNIVVDSS